MPFLSRGWIPLFSAPRWSRSVFPLHSSLVLQVVGQQESKKERVQASLFASFLLHPLYILKQTWLYLLCITGTFFWTPENWDRCDIYWISYRCWPPPVVYHSLASECSQNGQKKLSLKLLISEWPPVVEWLPTKLFHQATPSLPLLSKTGKK